VTPARPRRALILDDEAERRHQMRDGLLDHGVTCDEAATVAEAIGRLVAATYDLVVCDMILCDPPGAANPALRGYLAACFALTRPGSLVVQASSLRRWAHPGAVLTNWSVAEVADLVYAGAGIPPRQSTDGGCPWVALQRVTAAPPRQRQDAVQELLELPVVRELESALGPALGTLEDAAHGLGDWGIALAATWRALFPGAGYGH
jgi:hypothetical protein